MSGAGAADVKDVLREGPVHRLDAMKDRGLGPDHHVEPTFRGFLRRPGEGRVDAWRTPRAAKSAWMRMEEAGSLRSNRRPRVLAGRSQQAVVLQTIASTWGEPVTQRTTMSERSATSAGCRPSLRPQGPNPPPADGCGGRAPSWRILCHEIGCHPVPHHADADEADLALPMIAPAQRVVRHAEM